MGAVANPSAAGYSFLEHRRKQRLIGAPAIFVLCPGPNALGPPGRTPLHRQWAYPQRTGAIGDVGQEGPAGRVSKLIK